MVSKKNRQDGGGEEKNRMMRVVDVLPGKEEIAAKSPAASWKSPLTPNIKAS
jgi:hypothetical protein